MSVETANAKIRMLKGSLRCFTYGLLGLLPFIGLPCALAALWIAGQVRVKEKQLWNAARPYRIWGVICAVVGTVLWTGILGLIVAHALMVAQGID